MVAPEVLGAIRPSDRASDRRARVLCDCVCEATTGSGERGEVVKVAVVDDRRDETGIYLTIECSRDGHSVRKRFRMSGNKKENGYTLAKYVREADRDIAVAI